MAKVIEETSRRREIQTEYNRKHGIEPKTIYKTLEEIMSSTIVAESNASANRKKNEKKAKEERSTLSLITSKVERTLDSEKRRELIEQLRAEMINAAKDLEFERAAELRDEIEKLNG